jgi:YaiO family outer membrane protein
MKKVFSSIKILCLVIGFSACCLAQTIESNRTNRDFSKPETPAERKYEFQLNVSNEYLSRNLGTWRTASLYLQRKFDNKQIVWFNYRLSDRKSIKDQEFVVGTYKPFRKKWAFTTEATVSPTSKFVGKFSVMAEIERNLKKGWVVHGGSRFTTYGDVKVFINYGLAEKYWRRNRVAYTLNLNSISNAGTATSHRIQYNRYYGERNNSYGLAFSIGRELENLGPEFGILRSQTWSVSVSERHWFNSKFGINIDAALHRQGSLYYRKGLNFGVRYRF